MSEIGPLRFDHCLWFLCILKTQKTGIKYLEILHLIKQWNPKYIYGTAQIIQQTMLNIVKGPEQASLQRRNIHGQEIWKYMQYN